MAAAEDERLCVGVIAGAHGVRGLVKIKSFTDDPANLTAYGPLTDESGARRYQVAVTGRAKGVLLARIEGVGDRDAARALSGARLYVARAALPEPEDEEYYHADLIGLAVEDRAGAPLGRVAAVPLVDPAGGRVVVEPPEETEAQPD